MNPELAALRSELAHDGAPENPPWFTRERTARKRYRCSNCLKPVEPGQRYHYHAMPPGSDMGNPGWWHSVTHLPADCRWD